MSADTAAWADRAVLNAFPDTVLVLDDQDRIDYINQAGEHFFRRSSAQLITRTLVELLPADSPLHELVARCRRSGRAVAAYQLALNSSITEEGCADVRVAPVGERTGALILTLHGGDTPSRLNRQLSHRSAARSVSAIARTLAHEVKNPMSGVRGAAQLLEQSVADADRELTRVIRDEANRVVALVQRMEVFADDTPPRREPVNLHAALDHARRVAENGFARHVRFNLDYDPSLPPAEANWDQLVQIFLNIMKNSAEVLQGPDATITLETAYQYGVRVAAAGAARRQELPLRVTLADNGPGIPEEMQQHLFDAFVSAKPGGSGLGLALVAKVIGEHGGLIDCRSDRRGTALCLSLPMADADPADAVASQPSGGQP